VDDGPLPLEFAANDEALAWYDQEWANLVAATRQAAAVGQHEIAARLPPTLFPLFNRRSNWVECVTTNRIAVESAHKLGDRLGEAWAINVLGFALAKLRDPEAFGRLEQALAIRQEFGDAMGEAQTALSLGEGYLNVEGPGEAALRYMRHATSLLRPNGPSTQLAAAVNNLGEVYRGLGDLVLAAECYAEARDICREIGGYGEGHALHNLGRVYLDQRRIDDASACFVEAVRAHRASGDLIGEAIALNHLGQARVETGDISGAQSAWTSAQAIYEQIGEEDAAAELAAALQSLFSAHRTEGTAELHHTFHGTSGHRYHQPSKCL
jgi:tetratricopeptide (TPR) repeat protein